MGNGSYGECTALPDFESPASFRLDYISRCDVTVTDPSDFVLKYYLTELTIYVEHIIVHEA